jgi:uncharacterized membrane protein
MMEKLNDLIINKVITILLSILVGSLGLRLYHLNFQSLWLDELYSIVSTDPRNSIGSIIEYCKIDQPPLFFLYLHSVFKLTVYNEIVGRFASALIGLLGVLAVYFLGKECQGERVGLFASFLAGINYFHIYYSQEVRFYGMAFLFTALSYLFFIRAFKNVKAIDFFWYSFSTICLIYTHYFGLIILGIQGLSFVLLLFLKSEIKFIVLSLLSGVIIVLTFSPWIPVVMNDISTDLGWIKSPSPYFVVEYFYDYTGKDALTTTVFLIFIYFFFRAMIKRSTSKEMKVIYILIVIWIALSYLIPYVRSILIAPILNNRYTIITLPAWIIVFAIGWDKLRNVKWKYSLPLILILSFMVNMAFFKKHYTRIQKSQFREASDIVLVENKFGYPVYSSLPWHYNFYFRKNQAKVLDLNTADLSHIQRFWILQAHYSIEEREALIKNLNKRFSIVEYHSFYEADAVLLERRQ